MAETRLRLSTATDHTQPNTAYVLIEMVEDLSLDSCFVGIFEIKYHLETGVLSERIQPGDRRFKSAIDLVHRENAPINATTDPKSALDNIPLEECRRVAKRVIAYAQELQNGLVNAEAISLLLRDYAAHEWNRRHPTGG